MDQFKNEGLDRYCMTDGDRATWAALLDSGGDYKAMAELLGVTPACCRDRLYKLRKRAALRGWSPTHDVTHPTPEGYHLKGTSTLYTRNKKTGEIELRAQWVKTDKDREDRIEAMRIVCAELVEPLKGIIAPVPDVAVNLDEDLMATYLIGDHHTGMYSWAEETGADYDCDIAESILNKAFSRLGAAAPAAHKALIVSIGDFFHADDHSSRTPASGHALDTDTRHSRVIQMGIRMMRRAIEFALTKHKVVEVRIIAGNHDPESSVWLAHALAAVYDSEPRVTVEASPRAYQYVMWGACLIGTTHGEKVKPAALAEVMAVDCRELWGAAAHCHWYTGHVHHKWLMELRGCIVESLSVLCPADAWHAAQGYRSKRGMQMDVWHKRHGRVITAHGTVEYINATHDHN